MKTITDRGYVIKEGRTLIPTDTGDVVSSFLEKHFIDYISDTFTSEMEDELDEIAEGKRTYIKTLSDFYLPFQKDVVGKEDIEKITNLGPGPKQFPCPVCGSDMIIKLGRSGNFLSCSRFPDCNGSRLIDGSELKPDAPLGIDPETGLEIFLLNGKFGPYVQLGTTPEKVKGKKATPPKRASLPAGKKLEEVTLEDALKFLTLPRELGTHPKTGEPIIANTGQFGPYIAHAGDFRSLKGQDDPYTITYERAIEIYKEPKQARKGEKLIKELGINPSTRKMVNVYESKSGRYLRKGFKRISIPEEIKTEDLTIEIAVELLKRG
jgi:DNA topoisomerase-1